MLLIKELWKIFDLGDTQVEALRGVSAHIHKGEYVAIMGPSGSGKSTFMNLLGCLDTPTRGTIHLHSQDISELTLDERAGVRSNMIGFVFQNYNLIPRMTALEQVMLPLIYRYGGDRFAHRRAFIALDNVGMKDRVDHFPTQLSGGQQQRVAIARALINEPSLLLADEPTGNLDSKTGEEILQLFQSFREKFGTTIVVVTHEENVAKEADRIIRFRDGKIIQE